jgi:sarcosine oxidase
MNKNEYDTIIVGLGCFGLGTAYYLSKMGQKVLGLERNNDSGLIGSGSTGYGRIWRLCHNEDRYMHMQLEALEIWRDIEKVTGQELL